MSKQLTLSAVLSVLAMAAFALCASPSLLPGKETGATTIAAAPAFEASLPSR
jgi:hypothetical protein